MVQKKRIREEEEIRNGIRKAPRKPSGKRKKPDKDSAASESIPATPEEAVAICGRIKFQKDRL